jgi:outer membrane protein OmpA-like peptidoglycan-associated protein
MEQPNTDHLDKGKRGAVTPQDRTPTLTNNRTPVLKTRNFTIFGTGPNIDLGNLAKEVIGESARSGPKAIREVIQGIGDGVDVAKKTVDLTSDLVDLYHKIRPEKTKDRPLPPSSTVLPQGTLLDQRVTFGFNSSDLNRSTIEALDSLAKKLKVDHKAVIVEGHADGVGSAAYNNRLSQKRADAVWPAPGLDDTDLSESCLPLELHRA